tara:strand:- start:525 stop:860 length:336 start_codon:yes stop_codon:yes gene_type:complete
MFNKKIIFSLIVFIFFMIVTSTIKNGTRIIEKNIYNNQKRISILKNNLYELQLDYSYLTSPELISQKIFEYSNKDYESIKFSKIYFNIDQFLQEQNKILLTSKNEKKIKNK